MKPSYVFTSDRLGFRNWYDQDLADFTTLNSDPSVMEHFPKTLSRNETVDFMVRLQNHFEKYQFNYFATEIKTTGEFIGFIGLAHQEYLSPYTPATDIGWRLKKEAWKKGYATEGAKRCLEYAFSELQLTKVIATCTLKNTKSEHVMKKIGMIKVGEFLHPKLNNFPDYQSCLCYEIKNPFL